MKFSTLNCFASPPLPALNLTNILSLLFSAAVQRCVVLAANFKWTVNFLFHHYFFHHRCLIGLDLDELHAGDNLGVRRYLPPPPGSGDPAAECAVCLLEVEEGEYVKELRCDHVFHSECMDRWVGYRPFNATCPLCRDVLRPPRMVTGLGEEVVVFHRFCSFDTAGGDDGEMWWLR